MKKTLSTILLLLTLVVSVLANNLITQSVQLLPFPELGYSYSALEPYIDQETMELHYSKHFRTYYNNLMAAATTLDTSLTIKNIFDAVNNYPVTVKNNLGGYYNHYLFFENLTPKNSIQNAPSAQLLNAIVSNFTSFENFKTQFNQMAQNTFGSGWVWLCVNTKQQLYLCTTPNQDNPLMQTAINPGTPILALDLWEHAYYLKYKNKRTDYIDAFWNVINWTKVNERYQKATLQ